MSYTLGGFWAGFTDSLVNNFGFIGVGQNLNTNSPWYYVGKFAGDVASVYAGEWIANTGGAMAKGGLLLTTTGVGAAAGLAVTAEGVVVAGYGLNTIKQIVLLVLHGTNKIPCSTCDPLIQMYKMILNIGGN